MKANLDQPNVRILDVRSANEFNKGHILNAQHFDIQSLQSSQSTADNFLEPQVFEVLLQNLGINQDDIVVIYDQGENLAAAYLFFILEYYGHWDKVRLLNGGYSKYLLDKGKISLDNVTLPKGNFRAESNEHILVSTQDVLNSLEDPDIILLDTRRPTEYWGQERRTLIGGHIPGALNVEWITNLKSDISAGFKSIPELKEAYPWLDSSIQPKIIVYCHTGLRASNTYFVLRLLGAKSISLYRGSWAEWGNRLDLPYE